MHSGGDKAGRKGAKCSHLLSDKEAVAVTADARLFSAVWLSHEKKYT